MYTLHNLPPHGVVRVYVTAERVTPESAEHGDAAERGYVSEVGSREIYESRNDVAPAFEATARALTYGHDYGNGLTMTADEMRAAAREIVESLGAYEDNGDGTSYAAEAVQDYRTGDDYFYAVHGHVKYLTARGWLESPVDIMPTVSLVKAYVPHPAPVVER